MSGNQAFQESAIMLDMTETSETSKISTCDDEHKENYI